MGKIKNRKLNKKGFTLIELLAVIVILAILILLAMPSVLRIMENARKNAFETEVRSYLKAAQTKYAEMSVAQSAGSELIFQDGKPDGDCTSAKPCSVDIEDKSDYHYVIKLKVLDDNVPAFSYKICSSSYGAEQSNKTFEAKTIGATTDKKCTSALTTNVVSTPTDASSD